MIHQRPIVDEPPKSHQPTDPDSDEVGSSGASVAFEAPCEIVVVVEVLSAGVAGATFCLFC